MTSKSPARQGPVVVGVTESGGHAALHWAATEALRRGVTLRILHAYSAEASYPWGYGYPLPAGVLHNAEEVARGNAMSVLQDAADQIRDRYPDLEVTTTLARMSAAASLVAEWADASTLVVGRREHRHPRLAALGSVSLAVAAHAACPVVVIPAAERQPGSSDVGTAVNGPAAGQVVVGVEDSPACLDAVGFAFAQAAARGRSVTAVHAWWVDPAVLALSEGAAWTELGSEEPVVVDALLAPWATRHPEVRVTRVVVRERPGDALVAAGAGAELLVVGSRGRGGFADLLLGSVSRDVLQHATCPVAVVRAGQLPVEDDLDLRTTS
jgi:nucleotide-binding universal stress UspA family protein